MDDVSRLDQLCINTICTLSIDAAHLLGSHAEEVINFFAIAMRFGLSPDQLKEIRYSYPSHSDDLSYMV